MFWEEEKKHGETKDETINTCIDANNLVELLELPYTLQELWGGNKKLLEYFCRKDVLPTVVETALWPDIDDAQPFAQFKAQHKLSCACTEILTVRSNNEITDALIECDEALNVLTKFFNSNSSKNHLLCASYMKIVQHLFHRSVSKMVETLASCDFLTNCIANIRMAALSELLQNIAWVPQVAEDIQRIKQWYVEDGLCRKLVDKLDPTQPDCVHENVMEVFTNVMRNSRDQMFALEVKSDILNDELQSEIFVGCLADKMLLRDKFGIISPSVTRNACEILISFLSTNTILFRPSHTLYKEFNAEIPWAGGNPSGDSSGEMSKEATSKSFCPDPERIVEKVVVLRVAEIVQLVVEELTNPTETTDETWSYFLRLIVELCDTNHMRTHYSLVEQFEKGDLKKLFLLVWDHPRLSIYHGILQRVVSFILFASTDQLSPVITFLFKGLNLLEIVRAGINPVCVLRRVDLFCIRTHHIHIALAIDQAMKSAPQSEGIKKLVQENSIWQEVVSKMAEWLSWNMPDPDVASIRPTNTHDSIDESLDDFERQVVVPQQHALHEFKNQIVSVPMTDVFDTTLGALQVSSETKGFAVHSVRVCKVDMNLDENDVDESDFEAKCAMRKCAILDDWPMQDGDHSSPSATFDNWSALKSSNGNTTDDWPGVSTKAKGAGSAVKRDWDSVPVLCSSDGWSCFPQDASTPRKKDDDDDWADFSSLKVEHGSASTGAISDWPGTVKAESLDWPGTVKTEAVDPVLAGFVTGVINSSLDERLNDSDC